MLPSEAAHKCAIRLPSKCVCWPCSLFQLSQRSFSGVGGQSSAQAVSSSCLRSPCCWWWVSHLALFCFSSSTLSHLPFSFQLNGTVLFCLAPDWLALCKLAVFQPFDTPSDPLLFFVPVIHPVMAAKRERLNCSNCIFIAGLKLKKTKLESYCQ